MNMTRWQTAWAVSFVFLVGAYAIGWAVSPDVLASHFNTAAPDGWMSRNVFYGFMFGITAFMNLSYLPFGVTNIIRRVPQSLWSLPDKDYWFRPENIETLYRRMARAMAQVGVGTNAMLAAVFAVVLAFNLGLVGVAAINVVVVIVLICSLLMIVPFLKAIHRP